MMKNVGSTDRIVRLVVGVVLLALVFFGGIPALAAGLWKWVAIIVGLVMIVTALVNFCPAYKILGVTTRKA